MIREAIARNLNRPRRNPTRLAESKLRNMIQEAVESALTKNRNSKRALRESRYITNQKELDRWANSKQIPQDVMQMIISKGREIGIDVDDEEFEKRFDNRYGETIGYIKAIDVKPQFDYDTYSFVPTIEQLKEFAKWLGKLEFQQEYSDYDLPISKLNKLDPHGGDYRSFTFEYFPSLIEFTPPKPNYGDDLESDDFDEERYIEDNW